MGARVSALATAAIATLGLAIAGCGGSSSSSPGVAHISSGKGASPASSAGGGSAAESTASPEQQAVAYSKCMRASGVPNFPDPKPGGGFLFNKGAQIDPFSPAFKTAQAKCRRYAPGGPPSRTNPSKRTLARFLKVAQCMREHGVYDFPDPRTSVPSNPFGSGSRSGVISDIEEVIFVFPSSIDEQSPTFEQAANACAFPLHNH